MLISKLEGGRKKGNVWLFGSVTVSAKSSGLLSRPAFTFWRVKGFFNLDGMSIDFKILMKQNQKLKHVTREYSAVDVRVNLDLASHGSRLAGPATEGCG